MAQVLLVHLSGVNVTLHPVFWIVQLFQTVDRTIFLFHWLAAAAVIRHLSVEYELCIEENLFQGLVLPFGCPVQEQLAITILSECLLSQNISDRHALLFSPL